MEKIYMRDIDDNQMEAELVRFFHFKNTNYLIYTKNEKDEKGYIKLYPVKVMESLGEKIARSIKDETEWDNMQSIVKTVIKEIKDEKIESFIDLDKNEIENLKIVDSRFFKLDPKLAEILGSTTMLGIDKYATLDRIENNIYDENLPEKSNSEFINNINDLMISSKDISLSDGNEFISSNNLITNEQINVGETSKNIVEDSVWQDKNIDFEVKNNMVENATVEEEIDYKNMYEALLQEKDELSNILTNMVIELTNYKIKYGELKEE